MLTNLHMIAFGPLPSRRLGRSLGVNNIPPKNCTFSCIYCQIGRTGKRNLARREFYRPEMIVEEVERKVNKTRERGESIDYLAFVPDGEPSLDFQHPMREEAVRKFLKRAGKDWSLIHNLVNQNQLLATEYEGKTYFIRKLDDQKRK